MEMENKLRYFILLIY